MDNTYPRPTPYQVCFIAMCEIIYLPTIYPSYAEAVKAAKAFAAYRPGQVFYVGIEKERSVGEGFCDEGVR